MYKSIAALWSLLACTACGRCWRGVACVGLAVQTHQRPSFARAGLHRGLTQNGWPRWGQILRSQPGHRTVLEARWLPVTVPPQRAALGP